jgi:hypothetical protein
VLYTAVPGMTHRRRSSASLDIDASEGSSTDCVGLITAIRQRPDSSRCRGSCSQVARLNAATIEAFHGREGAHTVGNGGTLRVFWAFFLCVFVWSILVNSWLQWLSWFPVLCWVCKSNACQVLGEGLLGTPTDLPCIDAHSIITWGWQEATSGSRGSLSCAGCASPTPARSSVKDSSVLPQNRRV